MTRRRQRSYASKNMNINKHGIYLRNNVTNAKRANWSNANYRTAYYAMRRAHEPLRFINQNSIMHVHVLSDIPYNHRVFAKRPKSTVKDDIGANTRTVSNS